ncbi:hypothetical protein A2U01_0023420, partial [Trifolium medium]|nr:hypothetical protein [Trifolium medium]
VKCAAFVGALNMFDKLLVKNASSWILCCSREVKRRVGGLAMFWKEGFEVGSIIFSPNPIDVLIAMEDGDEKWRFIGVYGFPESQI